MKSLLIKDCFVIFKQLKVFLIIITLMAVYPSMFTNGFAVVYAVMLPVTALAYDDQSRWGKMAAVMPYGAGQIVLSKYILGIGSALALYVVNIAASICITLAKGNSPEGVENQISAITMVLAAALLILSVNMPLLFKLGSEKGRMLNLLVTIAVALAMIALIDKSKIFERPVSMPMLIGFIIGAVSIILIISVRVSIQIYSSKNYA